MTSQKQRIFSIKQAYFKPYGRIIDYPRRTARGRLNLFRIIVRQRRTGWRIAYLVVREKVIDRLEQHPGSLESFEPVKGRALLFVARRRRISDIRCFFLDRPVILNKGLWHGVVALGDEADIKITENASVRCVYWKPGIRMGCI
jgi:ureidoglycolate hydrolase